MPRKTNLAVILPLLFYTSMHAQDTQTGQAAKPTSSVYNRMRPIPPAAQNGSQQNGTQQARQFPNPAQQFPPEQRVGPAPGQVPNFSTRPAPQPINQPQNGSSYSGMAPAPDVPSTPQQPVAAATPPPQAAYGLALQPPNPPNVTYANGQLMIVANNSSLADIVSGIERATGVRVEGTSPDSERVFGQFGPGSQRDVLNSLFDGSRYDFILVGSLENPADVRTIILSPHGTAPAAGVNTANNQPYRPPENNEEQEENEPNPVYQGGEGRPVQNVPSEQVTAPPPTPAQQQQPQQQVKTPEQLLQELQRLRQQQQQQQGQQQTPH